LADPVPTILVGAGQRGAEAYGPYALLHPDQIRFVALAEPDPERRAWFGKQRPIPPENQSVSWRSLLERPQQGKVALVCAQDSQHAAAAPASLQAECDALLDKPMAIMAEEYSQLIQASEERGHQLHICHVLRYTRHFQRMREIQQSGPLGQTITVDHRKNVSWWQMAHSYVRGSWRGRSAGSPMILAK
jgi:predicted dehydrogenase